MAQIFRSSPIFGSYLLDSSTGMSMSLNAPTQTLTSMSLSEQLALLFLVMCAIMGVTWDLKGSKTKDLSCIAAFCYGDSD